MMVLGEAVLNDAVAIALSYSVGHIADQMNAAEIQISVF